MFRRIHIRTVLIGLCLVPWGTFARISTQEANTASVKLPASKEELLGELSPLTDIPQTDKPKVALWRLEGPNYGALEDYTLDPTNLHFAARAKQGQKWVLIVDGKERGVYDDIDFESICLSPGGKHVVCSAKRAGKWIKVLNDKEFGPALDVLGGGFWSFGEAGVEHYAYKAKRGGKWLMIADGKEGLEFEELGPPRFSPDFQHLVYRAKLGGNREAIIVDGKAGPEFEEVGTPIFSPDGRHLAYQAKRKKSQEIMILDGKQGPQFEEVGPPIFSCDGQHLAYRAKLKKNQEIVVLDGKEGSQFVEVSPPVFSPDGRQLAYHAKREGKWRMLVGERAGPEFEADSFSRPLFSSDSQHVACVALRGANCYEVRDGKITAEVDAKHGILSKVLKVTRVFLESAVLGPDGQRLAYIIAMGDQSYWMNYTKRADRRVVVDGQMGTNYDSLAMYPMFSRDGRRFIYLIRSPEDKNSRVVIDGQEGKLYDDVIGGALLQIQYEDSSERQAIVYIARVGRKFYLVTQPLE